ncbi:zinc finger protein 335-like isoform X1 [Frankliniella occidentalis]|uniref:Zinc finger protein 335-like isoform X1 n=2 Tax=Frankliniella occidentalis TaxID=133901 RepID=A0A9C6WVH0_FRAOC|nr:zinc finger protein 335-like isoform X1 [Frankliniella occidentalis]
METEDGRDPMWWQPPEPKKTGLPPFRQAFPKSTEMYIDSTNNEECFELVMTDLQPMVPYPYGNSYSEESLVVRESFPVADTYLTPPLTPCSPATTSTEGFDPLAVHEADAETGGLGFAESTAQVDSSGSKSVGSKRKRSTGNSTTPAQPSKRVYLGRKSKASPPVRECDLDKLSNKPFKCDHCDKTFKTKEDLTRHARLHNPKMKKLCRVCGVKLSAQKQNLSRHMKTVHHMDNDCQELTDEDLLLGKCDFTDCNYKNSREDKVKNHMKSKHPSVLPINCNRTYGNRNPRPCRFICFTFEKLKEHILARHSDRSEASEE